MLSPTDFNNAVPQFTNGDYASNPINPDYIEEPDAVDYNRGVEPLQTLPAQWWNWFINKFTGRFNKVNTYVKNIFNELAQLLDLLGDTPDGTEATPTTGQLRYFFDSQYPAHVVSCTTGTACGCVPIIGTALGNTNNNILVTDASGQLKPSGITVGTAAGCNASCFLQSGDSIGYATCADCGNCNGTYKAFGTNAFNSTAFTTCTGTVCVANRGACDAYTPIALCTGATTVGRSTSCALTFNTCTGVLSAKTFCGALYGTANRAICLGWEELGKYGVAVCCLDSSTLVLCGGSLTSAQGAISPKCVTVDCAISATSATSASSATSATCAQRACLYANAVMLTRDCCSCSSCCCPLRLVNNCSFNVVAIMHIRCTSCSWYNLVGDYIAGTYVPANGCVTLGCSTTNTGTPWCVCGLRIK